MSRDELEKAAIKFYNAERSTAKQPELWEPNWNKLAEREREFYRALAQRRAQAGWAA